MYTIFVFAKCCWSVHSKVVKLTKNARSKQRKATTTQTLQFHVNVYSFNIWFGMVQHQKQLGCREGRKID